MLSNPAEFANLLDAAAATIERQDVHPGQSVPGVWSLGGRNTPERVIGIVAADALAQACRECGADLERALKSYVEASRGISIIPKGGPDVMAARHLRDAAAAQRRRLGSVGLKLVV